MATAKLQGAGQIQPVSKLRHGAKRWRRYTSYDFAAHDTTVPIVVAEFSRACMVFPIAFVQGDDGFSPVAVMGTEPHRNLYLSSSGQWLGGYIPAAYRGYPFRLGKTQDGKRLLCVDEGSGLLFDTAESSGTDEVFFDETDAPSEAITKILGFLSQVDDSRIETLQLCDLLEVNKLIEPWPLTISSSRGEHRIQGLFRINEAAVRSLKSRAISALHKENGFMAIYCQLLSMQTAPLLGRLIDAHAKAEQYVQNLPPPAPSGEIDFSFLVD